MKKILGWFFVSLPLIVMMIYMIYSAGIVIALQVLLMLVAGALSAVSIIFGINLLSR